MESNVEKQLHTEFGAVSGFQITRRFLPHWRMDGAWYFVTFRVWKHTLSEHEIVLVRQHITDGAKAFYNLAAVCVMPDHVHLILCPRQRFPLSRVMHGIKGVSAYRINAFRNTKGRVWQVESWDRIIRDENELHEKSNYMLQNPVKAGLVEDPWSWCGWYVPSSI